MSGGEERGREKVLPRGRVRPPVLSTSTSTHVTFTRSAFEPDYLENSRGV